MNNFEIVLIVGFALSPFVALLFILPKKLKKEKTPPPTMEYKPEKPVVEEKKEEIKTEKPLATAQATVKTDEFKDYLANKRKNLSMPKHLNNPNMPTEDFVPSRFRRRSSETK